MVKIASLEKAPIKSCDADNWGDTVDVDLTLETTQIDDLDAFAFPGGQINPDLLRRQKKAVDLVNCFLNAGKTVAAVCYGPWLLIEAGGVRGRKATSYASIRTDMLNAGADWRDEAAGGPTLTAAAPVGLPARPDRRLPDLVRLQLAPK